MITFKDLIKDVFSSFGINLTDVQTQISSLKISNIQPNNLVAGMNAYKYFKVQSEVYYVSETIIDIIGEICRDTDDSRWDDRGMDALLSNEFYKTAFMNRADITDTGVFNFSRVQSWILQTQDTTREVVCGYLMGRPVKLEFVLTQTDDTTYITVGINISDYQTVYCFDWYIDGTIKKWIDMSEQTLSIPFYEDPEYPDLPTSIQHILLADLSSELDDGVCNNQLLCELITAAQANGSISKASIKAVIENYEGCTAASELKQRISCIDELNSTNVMSLIGAYLRDATTGVYEEGEEYYEPLKAPKFTKNLLATIVTILASVVAVVLSIVFKAAAAIIAVIWTVVSTIWSAIASALPDTNPTFVRTSELPVWNYPIYTRENIPVVYDDQEEDVHWNLNEKIFEPMQEFGSIAAFNSTYDALCIWMAQDGYDDILEQPTVFGQILLPCWKYNVNNYGEYRMASDGDPIVFHFSIPVYTGCAQYAAAQACDYSWLEYTQSSGAQTTGQITEDLFLRIVSLIRSVATTASNETDKVDCPGLIPPSTTNQMVAFGSYLMAMYPDKSIQDLCTVWFCCFRRFIYNDPDWEATFENIVDLINDSLVSAAAEYYLITWLDDITSGAETADFACGRDCMEPCGEFPTIAKGAIFRMIIALAITAAVTAGVTIGVKAHRKKRACQRLALREQQFESAKKAYLEDPDDNDKLKALNKANRKLNRAWTKAAHAGLQTWNGFATGAESECTAYETAKEKLESEYSNMDDTAVSSGQATLSVDNVIDLIKGQEI